MSSAYNFKETTPVADFPQWKDQTVGTHTLLPATSALEFDGSMFSLSRFTALPFQSTIVIMPILNWSWDGTPHELGFSVFRCRQYHKRGTGCRKRTKGTKSHRQHRTLTTGRRAAQARSSHSLSAPISPGLSWVVWLAHVLWTSWVFSLILFHHQDRGTKENFLNFCRTKTPCHLIHNLSLAYVQNYSLKITFLQNFEEKYSFFVQHPVLLTKCLRSASIVDNLFHPLNIFRIFSLP